ncbi:MAG TPA: DUF423 domain-containing protein [Steroidobacteraceae bacterium]|nr:DUF423 domain-containing protein [Steroidobacteraceae bacterium]
MNSGRALAAAGVLVAIATACGAFGAHALKAQLPPERLEVWEVAVRYQFFQALGLLGVGLTLRMLDAAPLRAAATLIVSGVVLFSGSLYALALGAPRALGVLTPLGGLAWIVGWLVFAWGAWQSGGGNT